MDSLFIIQLYYYTVNFLYIYSLYSYLTDIYYEQEVRKINIQSRDYHNSSFNFSLSTNNKSISKVSNQNKKKTNEQSNNRSIKASDLNKRSINQKNNTKQNSQYTAIENQIQNINKQIETIKESNVDKISKDEKIKQLQDKIKELQQQLAQAKQLEAQQAREKKHERKEEKIAVTDAQKEAALKKANANEIANLVEASSQLRASATPLASAHKLITKSDLGRGSKYKGNLTLSEQRALLNKATTYLSYAGNNLNNAVKLSNKAGKCVSEYKKHSKELKNSDVRFENEMYLDYESNTANDIPTQHNDDTNTSQPTEFSYNKTLSIYL